MTHTVGRALKGPFRRPKWKMSDDYPSSLDLTLLLLVASMAAALLFGG